MNFCNEVMSYTEITRANTYTWQICPGMQVNEMHALYDKNHKVSPFL